MTCTHSFIIHYIGILYVMVVSIHRDKGPNFNNTRFRLVDSSKSVFSVCLFIVQHSVHAVTTTFSNCLNLGNCMETEGVVPLNNKIFDPNMTNHSIDIYFFAMSPPSRAALLTMRALGIKHNIKITNPMAGDTMKPEFLKMNPLHTIPTIDDNGFVLYDSSAIMKYLVDQYGKDDSLYPREAKKSARVTQRLFYMTGTLFPRFVATHIGILRGATVEEDDIGKLKESLQYLDKILEDSKWIAGDNMTIADFSIISVLASIEAAGLYDLSTYHNLWQWFERSKSAMSSFGYDEIMQTGAEAFGSLFKKSNN